MLLVKAQLKKNLLVWTQNIPPERTFRIKFKFRNTLPQLSFSTSICTVHTLTGRMIHFHTGFPNYDDANMSVKVGRLTSNIRSVIQCHSFGT